MNNEKKLPENWLVEIRNDGSTIDARFKQWYQIESNDTYSFTSFYYGKNRHGDFVNVNYKPDYYKLLTLEEWDVIVNPKEEKSEDRVSWDYIKVTGKRIGYMDSATKEYIKYFPNPIIKLNNNKISDSIGDTSKVYKLKDGSYSESRQPKLNVGDKIPEFLDGKITYTGDGLTDGEKYIGKGFYRVNHIIGSNYVTSCNIHLPISEVDALIEEHERELEKTCDELFPIDDESTKEQWEPKNGDDVECQEEDGTWVFRNYIGKNNKRTDGLVFCVADENGNVWFYEVIRKPLIKITKTHSEIAQLLGISKEQLKIVEG